MLCRAEYLPTPTCRKYIIERQEEILPAYLYKLFCLKLCYSKEVRGGNRTPTLPALHK
jgi:hypothetical protein